MNIRKMIKEEIAMTELAKKLIDMYKRICIKKANTNFYRFEKEKISNSPRKNIPIGIRGYKLKFMLNGNKYETYIYCGEMGDGRLYDEFKITIDDLQWGKNSRGANIDKKTYLELQDYWKKTNVEKSIATTKGMGSVIDLDI